MYTLTKCPTNEAHTSNSDLLLWFFDTFIPEPERGYDLMNPVGAVNKYIHRNEPLTYQRLTEVFDGGTRRLQLNGRYQSFPLSVAVVPQHSSGWAKGAVIDIDRGGLSAVQRTLAVCQQHDFWAFAQLSTSSNHDGGHIYIPAARPQPASLMQNIAARIQAAAEVLGEVYPDNLKRKYQSLRLPLMFHLLAPNGPLT